MNEVSENHETESNSNRSTHKIDDNVNVVIQSFGHEDENDKNLERFEDCGASFNGSDFH